MKKSYVIACFVLACLFLGGYVMRNSMASLGVAGSTAKKTESSVVTLGFGGDTMLGRLVNETLQVRPRAYVWGDMRNLLHKNDLNIVNLETTLTRSNNKALKVFNFKLNPQHVQVLSNGHIGVVSLANNHTKDFGDSGLVETIATLDRAGIAHVGAGNNSEQARRPVVIEKKGVRIGILGATDNEPTWVAGADTPGINYFTTENMQFLLHDIAELKKQVDIVIVSLHWGPNMRERPTQEFVQAAHAMVDAGADIVHGHSAHIFQGVEVYGNSLILYDTGDFVDDYRVDPVLRNDLSFLFTVDVSKKGVKKLQLTPTKISNMQVNHALADDAQWALARMQKLSGEFGMQVQVVDGKGVVKVG